MTSKWSDPKLPEAEGGAWMEPQGVRVNNTETLGFSERRGVEGAPPGSWAWMTKTRAPGRSLRIGLYEGKSEGLWEVGGFQ